MDKDTLEELEKEISQEKEKLNLLSWTETIEEIKNILPKKLWDMLLSGINEIEKENYNDGLNDNLKYVISIIDKRIVKIEECIKNGKLNDKHLTDNDASFLFRLKNNYINLKNFLKKNPHGI